jgi:hypothetical protein
MELPYRFGRVALWTFAGVIVGIIVGAPLAKDAERRDSTTIQFAVGSSDPWGMPPNGPVGYRTANAAARSTMQSAIAAGFIVGLFIGLARNGFLTRCPIQTDCTDPSVTPLQSASHSADFRSKP